MLRRLAVAAALSSACSPAAVAPRAAPLERCDSPAYHRLDFWLGEWDVTDARGAYDGTNVVERTLSGCAIAEHWRDANGRSGESLFHVDRASGAWRQTWATDEGSSKEKREVDAPAGAVRFEGARDRTTLTPLADGRVEQVIESRDGRASWTGIYSRHPRACSVPEARQLDFWIGDWSVKVRSRVAPDKDEWSAELPGSNHVSSVLSGCAIDESFVALDTNGRSWSGRSHSTWIAAEKRWRQTWVDDSGNYLAFTGGMNGGEFVLVGEPRPDGRVMRMVFGAIAKDHITWRWEASRDGREPWRAMMIIEYKRLR
jgi:hypothetical protein